MAEGWIWEGKRERERDGKYCFCHNKYKQTYRLQYIIQNFFLALVITIDIGISYKTSHHES